ncbi:hypothetical protein [Hydrogenimonas sp.]
MAHVKLVGPAPRVSDKGVTFDRSREDKYLYLGAALQLAEAFDIQGEVHDIVYRPKSGELSETVINEMLQKRCPDLDERIKAREEEAKKMVEELRERVEAHPYISEEGKRAWLKNIDVMKDYYLQYITNETAYECVLERIADEIERARIEEIKVPMKNQFAMVLHELGQRLENRKPPIDMEFHIEQHAGEGLVAIVKLRHA